ncbi:MAG: hypothetical protein U0Q11_11360 [Vicinamibacterales bacterium]
MGNMVAARWSAVWLTMLVVLGTVAPLFAQNSMGQAISVRIYDYDDTNPDQIRLAQRDVTQTFGGGRCLARVARVGIAR